MGSLAVGATEDDDGVTSQTPCGSPGDLRFLVETGSSAGHGRTSSSSSPPPTPPFSGVSLGGAADTDAVDPGGSWSWVWGRGGLSVVILRVEGGRFEMKSTMRIA